MKSKPIFAMLLLLSMRLYAGPYEDCVLSGMKGVASDAAARAVNQACRNKDNEARKEKQAKMGLPMRDDEYAWSESNNFENQANGFVSEIFKNKSNDKQITYVALEVLDADYYEYKKPSFLAYDFDGESAWKRERSQTYYFKLLLKPNEVTKLFYRMPRTKTWWTKVTTVLGRESKWSDSISPSTGNTTKPEPKDPLE